MAGKQDPGLRQSRWAQSPPYNNANSNNNINNNIHMSTLQSHTNSRSNTANQNAPTPSSTRQPSPATSQSYLDLGAAQKRIPTPWAELARYTKIVRRLRWKLPFLSHGYDCAIDQSVPSAQQEEAELMFKLDFFEYYMLLERALVHLLGVFGIKVTGGFGGGSDGGPKSSFNGNQDGKQALHRFHANVLESLDDPANPLHQALGQDDVRSSLGRAKELRNRWKNADDPAAALATRLSHGDKAFRPLTDYDLGRILKTIFYGFDKAFHIADRYVTEVRALAAQHGVANGTDVAREQADEWEFMVEAMDWEAV